MIVSAETKVQDKIDVTMFCYDTDRLFKLLNSDYKELPLFMGNADDIAESTMSLWVSKNGNSWTIVSTKNDTSCVVGSGKNLQVVRSGKSV
jgi:hypothetical protein